MVTNEIETTSVTNIDQTVKSLQYTSPQILTLSMGGIINGGVEDLQESDNNVGVFS